MKVGKAAEIAIKDEIRGMCYENGKLYMTIPYIHAIITYDLQTRQIKALGYYNPGKNVFEKILKFRDKIYLFPANGIGIYYYDLIKKEYKELFDFDSVKSGADFTNRKFFEVFEYKQLIYAVCRYPNAVICINPFDDVVQVHCLPEKLLVNNPMVIEHFPVYICENKFIYAYSSTMVIEFSLVEEKFKIVYLEEDDCNTEYEYMVYGMILNDSGDTWLYNLYGDLFRIINNRKVRVAIPEELVGAYDDGYAEQQYRINQVLSIKDKLCFVSQFDHRILLYDIRTNVFTWHENPYADWEEGRRKLAYIVCAKMDANSYLFYHYNNSAIYVWNVLEGFTDKLELKMLVEEIKNNTVFNEYALQYFSREDDLEFYLAYISRAGKNKETAEEKYCGEKIYQSMDA